MSGGYWRQVHAEGLTVPTDRPLPDLTAELTRMLGDTDPELRDATAYPTLTAWIDRGVYDDLLVGLGDGMAAGLGVGIGEIDTDSVFRRSFSALVLARCIARDNTRPLVSGGKILEWGDRLATWMLDERDLRGFVPDKGRAHAVAHGADALGVLAASPHLATPELTVLLDVLAERLLTPVENLFANREPDRIASAVLSILRRNAVPLRVLEPWVASIAAAAGAWSRHPAALPRHDAARDPHLDGGNAEAFLRSLYLALALGPRPPAVRSDLVLVVVDALRQTNQGFLRD